MSAETLKLARVRLKPSIGGGDLAVRRNLSDSERWVRGIAGAIAVFLGIIAPAAAPWSTMAWFAGGVLVLTGVAGYCPIYDMLNYSSVEVGPPDDPNRWR